MTRNLHTALFFLLFEVFLSPLSRAQQFPPDSLRSYKWAKQVDLDTTVSYRAQKKYIDAKSRITKLIGNAEVVYQDMHLTAGLITIDWNKNLLIAETLPDSLYSGNNGEAHSDSVSRGYPTVTEGGQTLVGEKMFFNFKTKKARVIRGRTRYEEGYYGGSQIKKTGEDVYYVKGGIFTTCDLEIPHFHFSSARMKMIYQDRVIAKPVVLYIHGIPVAALPFAVFPNRQGRHSGILVPRFGQGTFFDEHGKPRPERYLRGLGYYWAASQYWDTKLEVDFFEKRGFIFHSTTNYAVRYLLRGSVSWSLLRQRVGGQKTRRFDLSFNHSHTISPTMSVSAYGTFVSDGNYYNDFSGNRGQRLQKEIRSNATLTKSWPGAKNSLSINISGSQYLETESWRATFPQINFRHGQEPLINLFRKRKKRTPGAARSWFENIYFSYNSQILNSVSETRIHKDSSATRTTFLGMNHRINMSSPFKLFRYFTLNQSLNYAEDWQDRYKEYYLNPESGKIESKEVYGFKVRRTFSTSLSFNTKIYGIFNINRWSIVGFRHVITPNISLSYQPDFSSPTFGYYQEISDTSGTVRKKDRWSGSRFGSTPRNARRSISFSVNNVFQMKRLVQGKAKKNDLFYFNFSSNYNFELDSLRLSPLRSSFRASPSRIFNFTITLGHSFYQYNKNIRREVNRFLFSDNPFHPLRLTNVSGSASLRLTNTLFHLGGKAKEKGGGASDSSAGEFISAAAGEVLPENRFSADEQWAREEIPWTVNLSFNYNEQRYHPDNISKTIWMNMNGTLHLTRYWRVQYTARFDLEKKTIISQDFRIYRDLHCWEASFTWTPTGPYKRFYLRINIKSSLLQDIKLEKRGGRSSIFGY